MKRRRACVLPLALLAGPARAGTSPAAVEIAVIGATAPQSFTLRNKTPVGFLVPLANAAAWADSLAKEKQLNEQLRADGPALAEALSARVVEQLNAQGLRAQLVPDVQRKPGAPDDLDLTQLAPALGRELLLQLSISEAGFLSGRFSRDYLPRLNVHALVYRLSRRDWPYDADLYYGVDARRGQDWALESAPRYAFPSFDALLGDLALARESLQAALDPLADRIARQVRAALDKP